jgi:hypothetical protein
MLMDYMQMLPVRLSTPQPMNLRSLARRNDKLSLLGNGLQLNA